MTDQGQLHDNRQFGKVPSGLIHDTSLTDGAIRLYAHMHWRYGQNCQNWEGQRSMAEFLDVTPATISKRIKELEAADWVVVVERRNHAHTGNFTTLKYHVFTDQDECRHWRQHPQLAAGESVREKSEIAARKSRAGVGGNPRLEHQRPNSSLDGRPNSSLDGQSNSSLDGQSNSSLDGRPNSSLDNPDSSYPDSNGPDTITSNDVAPQALGMSADDFMNGFKALLPVIRSIGRGTLKFRHALLIHLIVQARRLREAREREQARAAVIPEMIKAWLESTGAVDPTAYAKSGYRQYAEALHDTGITPDDIRAYVAHLKTQDFWRDKAPGWQHIARNIAAWRQAQGASVEAAPAQPVVNPSRPEYPDSPLPEEGHELLDQVFADLEAAFAS